MCMTNYNLSNKTLFFDKLIFSVYLPFFLFTNPGLQTHPLITGPPEEGITVFQIEIYNTCVTALYATSTRPCTLFFLCVAYIGRNAIHVR